MKPRAEDRSQNLRSSEQRSSSAHVPKDEMRTRGEKAAKPSAFRRKWVVVSLAVVFVGAILFATGFILHHLSVETTDDAFIDAHVVQVASKVAGRVAVVHVDDNQHVEPSAPLIDLDPRDFEAVVEQRKAALQNATNQRDAAQTNLAQAQAKLVALDAEIAASKAEESSAAATAKRDVSDLQRSEKLVKSGAISKQDYEHAATASQSQSATLEATRKRVSAAQAQLAEGKAAVASAKAQVQAAASQIDQAQAALKSAELDLSYTHVEAPEAGRVTNRTVEKGNYVQVGQPLLAIVPQEQWVTANFKETQLRDMRPGQQVAIRIDTFRGRTFRGHIDSIQRGSGAQFSLLPPENATGNYVKVVQRVPVKILFDEQRPSPLGPGQSVVPTVSTREFPHRSLILAAALFISAAIAIAGSRWLLITRPPAK